MNYSTNIIIFFSIVLFVVIFYLYLTKKEQFQNLPGQTDLNLVIKSDDIKKQIKTELETSLSNHSIINLPLVINDNNNICSKYQSEKEICLPGTQSEEYYCQNPKTGRTKASPIEYCNNWVTPEIQQNQSININNIINQALTSNTDFLITQLSEYDPYVLLNKKNLEQIKQKKILENTQNYLLNNNQQNVSGKELLLQDIKMKNEEYDDNITSSYYSYQQELKKSLTYQKYLLWCKYFIYLLLLILVIIISLNFLFTTI